ncbi:MAG: tetratricopeptide repeat protein, partial [Psychroserpens sp.]|nr:tetratricopeptide repeat protein [Psychroserpens sp.]
MQTLFQKLLPRDLIVHSKLNFYKIIPLTCCILLFACNSVDQETHYKLWEEHMLEGEQLLETNDLNEALPYFEKALEHLSEYKNPSSEDLFRTHEALGSVYFYLGKSKDSNLHLKTAIEHLDPKDEASKKEYSNLLNIMGLNHRSLGEFDEALEAFQNRLELIKEIDSEVNDDHAITINNMSTIYKRMEEFEKALACNLRSSEIIKSLYTESSSEYAKELSTRSQIYFAMGKCGAAFPIQERAMSIFPEKVKDTSFNYALTVYTMSLLYSCTNEYRKEIELLEEFKAIMNRTPKYRGIVINADNNLSVAYDNLSYFEKSLPLIS